MEKKPKSKVVESAIWFNWFTCTVWGLRWYHFFLLFIYETEKKNQQMIFQWPPNTDTSLQDMAHSIDSIDQVHLIPSCLTNVKRRSFKPYHIKFSSISMISQFCGVFPFVGNWVVSCKAVYKWRIPFPFSKRKGGFLNGYPPANQDVLSQGHFEDDFPFLSYISGL